VWRPVDGGKEMVEQALSAAALRRGEKRRRAGRGAVENGGALPLYRGQGGGWRLVIKTEKWSALMGTKWLPFK
jgi:hypothetical protein